MATITQKVTKNARRRGVTIYSKTQWRSRCLHIYAWRRMFKKHDRLPADTLWQHITVTTPTKDFKADVRAVEAIGYSRFKTGCSYNWLVDMATGEVAQGQPLDAKGAHTLNDKKVPGLSHDQNAVSLAIAVIGMPDTPLSHAAKLAISRLIAAHIEEGALTFNHDYYPHSLVAWKDCPCENTRREMPDINRGAKRLVRP